MGRALTESRPVVGSAGFDFSLRQLFAAVEEYKDSHSTRQMIVTGHDVPGDLLCGPPGAAALRLSVVITRGSLAIVFRGSSGQRAALRQGDSDVRIFLAIIPNHELPKGTRSAGGQPFFPFKLMNDSCS